MVRMTLNGNTVTGRTVDTIVRREYGKTATFNLRSHVGEGREVRILKGGKVVARGIAYTN